MEADVSLLWNRIKDTSHLDWTKKGGLRRVAFHPETDWLLERCQKYLTEEGKNPDSVSIADSIDAALMELDGARIKTHRLCCQAPMGIGDYTALSIYYRARGENRFVIVPGVNYIY